MPKINMKATQGHSLLELTMALALSLVFLSLMGTIYLAQQKASTQLQALSRLEENALIAANILRDDIHNAGYIGCAKFTEDFPIRNFTSYKNFKPQNVLTIIHNKNSDRLHILKTIETKPNKEDLVLV